ncbi:formin-like protein 7 [Coregonus clupeaformis]|uniref:formin-like protein 7 n=1 Tax=Coregonus clupeaformis TaxID=59861 RepID=UPI001E1C7A82|nr:formin-like protein 7 [Coregonus clupeaformis]
MKKGTFFSARKNQSLFDNNIKIKEMDNVELMLDSSAIPESGTAKVRSRPTVKHHTSSSDVVQGFNVPTPKVPVLPPFNRPKINRAVNGDRLSNGSAISVPDLVEGEIFIPPPPSMAPPPPPPIFIPPPPDFLGDLGDLDSIQHPSMPPPKPPSKPPSVAPSEEDKEVFTSMKPPPMPPPKPLSTSSSASSSSLSISTPPPTTFPDITEPPKFAPPQPPTDMRQAALKALKTPPTKPMRLSSIPIMYEPPQVPAPDPPIQTPTPSSFNPQNTAKLYSVPKTGILGRQVEGENRHKQILLLHDPGSTDSVPVQVNGTAPSVAPPAKPARRNSLGMQLEQDLQELKDNLQVTLQGQPTPPETWEEVKVEPLPLSAQQAINKPAETPAKASPKLQEAAIPPKMSPKLQKVVTAPVTEASQVKHEASPGRSHKFSPMLDRKLRNLKASAVTGTREGPATSPLALLMAAKEREKHRSTLSRENSTKSNEPSVSIQHSESNPNSFTVIPSSTFTSVNSQHNPQSVVPVKPPVVIQTPAKPQIIESVLEKRPIANPVFQGLLAVEKQSGEQRIPSPTSLVRDVENREDLCMPLLPPPPEFNDHDDVMESPPSSPPPDPPLKKVLAPTPTPVLPVLPSNAGPIVPVKTPSPAPPPPPPPKPKPPSPPKLLPPVMEVKPKLPVQTTPKSPPTQAPSSLSASQATLLSILQKKMLEMDHKMDNKMMAMKTDSDDWGSSLSEETKVPVVPRVNAKTPVITAKSKNAALSAKTQGLDMKELETKMAMNSQGLSAPSKVPISNGPQSKQAYGMTFMVRPGTKQPITVVSKGDSS